MSVIERTIGTVVANSTVSVNARIQGQMIKAFFKEGQMVKAGDILFQIDPRPYQATYDNALASLATAKAKADRYARLKAQNAIAAQEFDDAQAAYLEAKAAAEVGAPESGIHHHPRAGQRQDRPHADPAGQHGRRLHRQHQRHAAGHHQRNPAGEDFAVAAPVRPAAHPGRCSAPRA